MATYSGRCHYPIAILTLTQGVRLIVQFARHQVRTAVGDTLWFWLTHWFTLLPFGTRYGRVCSAWCKKVVQAACSHDRVLCRLINWLLKHQASTSGMVKVCRRTSISIWVVLSNFNCLTCDGLCVVPLSRLGCMRNSIFSFLSWLCSNLIIHHHVCDVLLSVA